MRPIATPAARRTRRHGFTLVELPAVSRSGRRAFTLIELLVTIGIMMFVLGVTVVGYQSMFRNVGVADAASKLRGALDASRVQAIQQRRPIRFEAQLVLGSTVHQWRVITDGADASANPTRLPEFVAVATNLGVSSTGVDGRAVPSGEKYRGAVATDEADEKSGTIIQQIAVTFGPDGSVRRWRLGGVWNEATKSYPQVAASGSTPPTTLFAIRLTNMRDTQEGQPLQQWVVVIPLTGALRAYDAEGQAY